MCTCSQRASTSRPPNLFALLSWRYILRLLDDVQSEVQLIKLRNRATAYTCDGPSPLFFDPEGRGDLLVPTCYAMWRCPHILEKLYTYSEVSPKVCFFRKCATRTTPAPPLLVQPAHHCC